MEWYVAEGGERVGPIGDEELAARVRDGRVGPDTLVWREGFDDWRPYGEVAGGAELPAVPAGAICAECGRRFPDGQLVRYGERQVCAGCKPLFFQKLREGGADGVTGAVAVHYGGFWIRLVAAILDGILLSVVNGIVQFVVGMVQSWLMIGHPDRMAPAFALMGFSVLFQMAVAAGYEIFFLGRFGATPGKMACGLKVVKADGSRVSYARPRRAPRRR